MSIFPTKPAINDENLSVYKGYVHMDKSNIKINIEFKPTPFSSKIINRIARSIKIVNPIHTNPAILSIQESLESHNSIFDLSTIFFRCEFNYLLTQIARDISTAKSIIE